MSEIVWAQPGLKWDGFKPEAYTLNSEKVGELVLKDASSNQELTIGDILAGFHGQKVELKGGILDLAIKSESKELAVTGPKFYLDLLKTLFRLSDHRVSHYEVLWYYYDSDSCTKDAQKAYYFFLVAGDKILDERVVLFDWSQNGFDPAVLISSDVSDPVWFDEPEWDRAIDKFWYHKFYTETRTGQLMVLRTDEPELYYYPEGRSKAGGGVESWLFEIHRVLTQLKLAIWILLALTVLELFLRWR